MRRFSDLWRPVVALGLIVILAAAISACGGGGDDSSSASTSGEASGGDLATAEATVEKYKSAPTEIGPKEPVGKEIPTGKKIVFVNCGAEACNNVGTAMEEAAEVLDWQVVQVNAEPTPQGIQAAFDQAIREKPDGVAELGFDKVTFERQLKQLNDEGIPVLAATGTDPSGSGIDLQIIGNPTQEESTRVLADKVIVDAGGEGEIGVVELTEYPSIAIYSKSFTEQIEKNCPDCTVNTLQVQPAQIGKDAAANIANWLRTNPDIEYVFLSLDQLGIGLPAAVQATGREMPKTYGKAPSAEGLEALETGERTAAVPGPTPEVGWQFMDAFARAFTGQSFAEDEEWSGLVLWSKEYDNLPATPDLPVIPGFQDQYKALWGK